MSTTATAHRLDRVARAQEWRRTVATLDAFASWAAEVAGICSRELAAAALAEVASEDRRKAFITTGEVPAPAERDAATQTRHAQWEADFDQWRAERDRGDT